MANCQECVHKFVCETMKGKIENSWAETCVAYRHRETCVAVVRCKDCKHYTDIESRCDHPMQEAEWCYDCWIAMEPNDFCSCGERKDNE